MKVVLVGWGAAMVALYKRRYTSLTWLVSMTETRVRRALISCEHSSHSFTYVALRADVRITYTFTMNKRSIEISAICSLNVHYLCVERYTHISSIPYVNISFVR